MLARCRAGHQWYECPGIREERRDKRSLIGALDCLMIGTSFLGKGGTPQRCLEVRGTSQREIIDGRRYESESSTIIRSSGWASNARWSVSPIWIFRGTWAPRPTLIQS